AHPALLVLPSRNVARGLSLDNPARSRVPASASSHSWPAPRTGLHPLPPMLGRRPPGVLFLVEVKAPGLHSPGDPAPGRLARSIAWVQATARGEAGTLARRAARDWLARSCDSRVRLFWQVDRAYRNLATSGRPFSRVHGCLRRRCG